MKTPKAAYKFKVFGWGYENVLKVQTERCLWVPYAAIVWNNPDFRYKNYNHQIYIYQVYLELTL